MLYAFGSNGSGQLGVGDRDDLSHATPISSTTIPHDFKIKQLAAGGNHTIILGEDGSVRATGNNEDGRCGIKSLRQVSQFTQVQLPLRRNGAPVGVKHISASWSATTFCCDDGRVYACGSGESGELGLGSNTVSSPSLQLISGFPPTGTEVVSLASGMAHTAAVLSNGDVYGWGLGRKGQLGEPVQLIWRPRKIAGLPFKAVKATCGRDFTFIVGEPSAGRIAVLGPNGYDRWGLRSLAPTTLSGWTGIASSWCGIYAFGDTGAIEAWGRDDRGQMPSEHLPEIETMAAGSEHCLALTTAGKVLAWGWGEHGNCGSRTDSKGDVKSTWNEIEVKGRVSKVFAGCATSFIVTADEQSNGVHR